MSRPFLYYVSRDAENRPVFKIQGDGIPLTEVRLTVDACLRQAKAFTEAAIEILEIERREKQAQKTGGMS